MKKLTIILSVTLLISFFFSCKKDKKGEPTPPITYANYSALKVGNYWIYEQFKIDETRKETSLNVFDSCYIEKDTLINSKIYFKVFRESIYPNSNWSFLRDSLHFIVNSKGKILFSSQDFSTTYNTRYVITGPSDTICKISMKMTDKNFITTTPAGSFKTINAKETFLYYPNWADPLYPTIKNVNYAENIGIVLETLPFYIGAPFYYERRLVRYHLN